MVINSEPIPNYFNILDYNFFTIYISVKQAFFTDSHESAADMTLS